MQTNEQYYQQLEEIMKLFRANGLCLLEKESFELAIKFSIGQSLNDFNLILHDQGDINNKIVDISTSLEEISKGIEFRNRYK